MKCEQPSYNLRNSVEVYEPGRLPAALQQKIEEFRFPLNEYSSPEQRAKELEYDRMYVKRSVYIVHYAPLDKTKIAAVARIIEKRKPEDKLPIEFATVLSTTADSSLCAKREIKGNPFPVEYYDNRFPVCEIGGLRAADIDPASGITIKSRYRAIDEVMKQCDKEVHDRRYKSFFLTCVGTPHMERLYHDKFFFDEVATISYGREQTWKALWRLPFDNPVMKIDYAKTKITLGIGFFWNVMHHHKS